MGRFRPSFERFNEKVKIEDNGCWTWLGNRNKQGYGTFHYGAGTRSKAAHRWSYETFREVIPTGLHIDHLCRNASCVNPNHLEPVTLVENNRRRWEWELKNKNPNICKNGHDISSPESTYTYRESRICKTCHAIWGAPSRKLRSEIAKAKTALKPRYKTPVKTHCKRGHPLEGKNVQPNGKLRPARTCRACYLERQRFATLKRRHPETYKALYGSLTIKECLEAGYTYISSSYQKASTRHLHLRER